MGVVACVDMGMHNDNSVYHMDMSKQSNTSQMYYKQ